MTLAALVLLVAALVLAFASWQGLGYLEKGLDIRLDRIERQAAQVIDNAAQARAQPPPQQPSGPDPDRVYSIQTAGAPAKGPATAAVTIAEFSDFQ